MSYAVRLSDRAAKDLDRLGRDAQLRVVRRLDQLSEDPLGKRISALLTRKGGLRKSRVGGWRIIFSVDEKNEHLDVVTIERRGQVYHRI